MGKKFHLEEIVVAIQNKQVVTLVWCLWCPRDNAVVMNGLNQHELLLGRRPI